MDENTNVALYDGEILDTVAGAPTIIRYMPTKHPTKGQPLVVFHPGVFHNARISYGGHHGSREEDFIAYWFNELGFNFLGLSYPIESFPTIMPPVTPGFGIDDWGQQAAQTTLRIVEEHQLTRNVIAIGWSMAGKILEPFSTAMASYGLTIDLFVAFAASPGVRGLLPPMPHITRTANGYAEIKNISYTFLRQLHDGAATAIDESTYFREYLGHTPVSILTYGLRHSSDQAEAFVEDELACFKEARSHNFDAFPMLAAIYPSSPQDWRHGLGDKATWGFMLTWKLIKDISRSKQPLMQEHWPELLAEVHAAPDALIVGMDGNHFFFVGEKGAKKAADTVIHLLHEARTLQASIQILLDGSEST